MTSRNQSLDALRGIAVLMVIICHYDLVTHHGSVFSTAMARGVDLFFVLSGFLIAGLLFGEFQQTGEINLKRFWVRRGFKIYPPFYAFLALTCWFVFGHIPSHILSEIFFLQSYQPHIWPHTWSLAIEEHFYLMLPILLWFLARFLRRRNNPFSAIPFLAVALSFACYYRRFRYSGDFDAIAFPTHMRIDALFAGVALSYFTYFNPDFRRQSGRAWTLVLGILLFSLLFFLTPAVQLTIAYLGFSCVVAWVANHPIAGGFLAKPFAWVGRYSYSIYLWHVVPAVALAALHWRGRLAFVAYGTAGIILGAVMTELVERPALLLREKFFPPQASSDVPNTTQAPLTASLLRFENEYP